MMHSSALWEKEGGWGLPGCTPEQDWPWTDGGTDRTGLPLQACETPDSPHPWQRVGVAWEEGMACCAMWRARGASETQALRHTFSPCTQMVQGNARA